MNLFNNLINIYDELTKDGTYPDGLFPIGYITKEVQIEVRLDEHANYVSASFISKKEDDKKIKPSTTLIAITEKSQSRTNAPAPNMLVDDLRYVAGDLSYYANHDYDDYFNPYMEQLKSFLESKYSNKYIEIVYSYLNKKQLIKDLSNDNLLVLNENGLLDNDSSKYDKDKKPEVFSYGDKQEKLAVRFIIVPEFGQEIDLSKDNSVIDSFSKYYISLNDKGNDIDYFTGRMGKSGDLFPKKIRSTGDAAKIISANDKSAFTFRGLYDDANEARLVNQILSDKAHNALRYLIKKQGIYINGKEILIFGNVSKDISLNFVKESFDDFFDIENDDYDSYDDYAYKVKQALKGYENNLNINDDSYISIVILDSMVPGRLSINYYKEYYGNEIKSFVKNIEKWYLDTLWYKATWNDQNKKYSHSYGTDSLKQIALCAYGIETEKGLKQDKKILDKTIMTLMLDIFNGRNVNYSLVAQLTNRAINPQKYDKCYPKVLRCACQINKKYYNHKYGKEVISLFMNNENNEINFQLGRLLAVMDLIENSAIGSENKHSETNAKKYFSKYFSNPLKTYEIIYQKILPYEKKLKNNYLLRLRQEIISSIDPEEFNSIRRLDGRALCGYDAQKSEFFKNIKDSDNNKKNESEE